TATTSRCSRSMRAGFATEEVARSTSVLRPGADDATLERCRKRTATLHRFLLAADFPGGALEDIRDPPLLLRRCVHDRGERSTQYTACFVELAAPAAMLVVAFIGPRIVAGEDAPHVFHLGPD